MAPTYSPSIQEAEIRKTAVQSQSRTIVRETLSWQIPSQKGASGVTQGIGPEFKPQYQKNNNNWFLGV
jgi:hypothetical protein